MITAEGYHVPVLLKESVDGLGIKPDGVYVDVTVGGGGHSREILSRLGAEGHLYSFDQDEDAEQNIVSDERFTFVRSNFRYLKNWMRYYGVEEIDGLLADLGVSSHHFDDETRGFSFRFDAPLDMRMNKRSGMTAADIVNNYSEEQLSDIFYIYGELKNARRIAAAIVKARAGKRIETTSELIQLTMDNGKLTIEDGKWKKDAAKLFQALRIEVMTRHTEVGQQSVDLLDAVVAHPVLQITEITSYKREALIADDVLLCILVLVETIQMPLGS